MTDRLDVYALAARHQLQARDTQRLLAWAGLDRPTDFHHGGLRVAEVAGAALAGFGLLMWIAANWSDWGRSVHFGLLMAVVLVSGAAAAWLKSARPALGLLSMLGIGGLFAYFGQTYQTGADAWQLFALWALLALPLCLGTRSDVLWAPWALVAMTGVSLWVYARTGGSWQRFVHGERAGVHAIAWALSALLVAGLGAPLRRRTGAGLWALRAAATLAVIAVTGSAMQSLFHTGLLYGLGLLALASALVAMAVREQAFDVFVASAVVLALNLLLDCGLSRVLLEHSRGDALIGLLLMVGLIAAGLLGASVSGILALSRRQALRHAGGGGGASVPAGAPRGGA